MPDTDDDTKACHKPRSRCLTALVADVLHETKHQRDAAGRTEVGRCLAMTAMRLEDALLWAQAAERGHL